MTTLCGLYVAQGIPWGFVTVTFAAWLAQPKHNLSVEQIGPILAVATVPWSFKFLWGPLMDRFTIPSMGRRRPWIIFAQSMAILVLGSMLLFDDLPGMVWTSTPDDSSAMKVILHLVPGPLAAVILLANIFVSLQDVAVDALAVDLLKEDERGVANGLMYGCSYLGTAIGGAGLGLVVSRYGIQAGLIGQAALLSVIMLLPLLFRERPSIEDGEHVDRPAWMLPDHTAGDVFGDLWKSFCLRSTLLGAGIALGAKIGIGVLTAVFVDYLLKHGWTQEEYTSVMGGYALVLGLCGSVLGGFAADRFGAKRIIVVVSLLLGGLWIGCGTYPPVVESKMLMKCLLISQEFLLGMVAVALFSLFMTISWPRVAATQFTTYMALMNLSTTCGSYAAGQLSTYFDVQQILIIAGLLQMAMMIPVLFIDPQQTRRVLGDA
ncbi:MAG: MFS transporter [Fuerstiella sp.]|nr:MFS transporter [Fuerstiella sp.]MCP4856623.1 MFS transporter [Fuerstiella sp.]